MQYEPFSSDTLCSDCGPECTIVDAEVDPTESILACGCKNTGCYHATMI